MVTNHRLLTTSMPSKRDQSFAEDRLNQATMSFGDHLDELRKRILLALVVPLPLSIIAFAFSNTLIGVLVLPLNRVLAARGLPRQMQVISPPEIVVTQLKLSVIAAIILSAPWMFWQAWKFISPGLYQHERRFVRFLIPGSAILTLCGVALMYFVMLPLMLRVLILLGSTLHLPSHSTPIDPRVEKILQQDNLPITLRHHDPPHPQPGEAWVVWPDMKMFVAVQEPAGEIKPIEVAKPDPPLIAQMFRLSDYVGFVLILFLGIVIAFQMPLAVVLLGWVGIVRAEWLRKQRKYAFFVCAIVAIVITPPDVVSMLIMLLPLYALYELGILLLVIAPASAVAEGRVFSWRGTAGTSAERMTIKHATTSSASRRDKSNAQSAQVDRPAQTEGTIPQNAPLEQSLTPPVDGKKDGS